MNDITNLIEQSRLFVTSLLTKNLSDCFCYHNLRHTQEVVKYARFLCEKENMDQKNRQLIELAAWFHDTGFVEDYANHERESAKIATDFLEKTFLKNTDIELINDFILATKLYSEKKNQGCKILSDADCFHFGLSNFTARSICLKRERELISQVSLSLKQFLAGSIMFLDQHEFFTDYGIQTLEKGKQENLRYMMRLEENLKEHNY